MHRLIILTDKIDILFLILFTRAVSFGLQDKYIGIFMIATKINPTIDTQTVIVDIIQC